MIGEPKGPYIGEGLTGNQDEQPPETPREDIQGSEADNIINFEEAKNRITAKSEQMEPDLESERARIELKVLEVMSTINTRQRLLSLKYLSVYDTVDLPDIDRYKQEHLHSMEGQYKIHEEDKALYLHVISEAQSNADIERVEIRLNEYLDSVNANLDELEKEIERFQNDVNMRTQRPNSV